MSPLPANPDLAELAAWSEPLISDVVLQSYEAMLEDRRNARILAEYHMSLWRSIVIGDGQAESRHCDLMRWAGRMSVTEAEVSDIDSNVLIELMHVISRRFQRSPIRLRDSSLEVMRVACWLTEARVAA